MFDDYLSVKTARSVHIWTRVGGRVVVGFSAWYSSYGATDAATSAVNRPASTVLGCRMRTAQTTPGSAREGEKGFRTKQRDEWLPQSTLWCSTLIC